ALARIATVGVDVVTHSDADRQRRVFFNKARLWGVVKQIISVLYIDGLVEGKKFFVDSKGDKYTLKKV
ncbi:MAG: hypothetical protein Q7J27_14645, partial [Syntrophales bacterium]|nr:hypothetical protein [Syntrophales bacterium]